MGEGNFIMPLNAGIRKKIGKKEGDSLRVKLALDSRRPLLSSDLMTCLKDDPGALNFFKKLPQSHQQYFSKWIESAKTQETKIQRITRTINALLHKMDYGQMIREKL